MNGPVGWGVVGAGWVARDHVVPAITADPGARLIGVCDRDPAALAGLTAELPGATATTTELGELLCLPGLDAVYVATPNDTHAEVVTAVARAGVDVLCEKPLAHDVDTARAAVAAVEGAGVLGATAFDQRFHPAHGRIAELVADRALGTVTAVRIVYGCWLPPEWCPPGRRGTENWRVDPARAGGGAMIDLAPHGVDLVGSLLGEDLTALTALTSRRVHAYDHPDADDGAVLTGRTASGVLFSSHVSFATADALPRRRLEVVGTAAQLVAVDTMGQTPGGSVTRHDAVTGAPTDVAVDTTAGPFDRQIAAFGAAVRGDAGWPYPLERDLALHELLLRSVRDVPEEVPPCP